MTALAANAVSGNISLPAGSTLVITGASSVSVVPPYPASVARGPFMTKAPQDRIGPFPVALTLVVRAGPAAVSYSVYPESGAEATLDELDFTTAVPLNRLDSHMAPYPVKGAVAFSVAPNPVAGCSCTAMLIADGVNIPTFPGMKRMGGSLDYLNDDRQANLIEFYFNGGFTWYSITNGDALYAFTPIAVQIAASVNVTDEGGGVYAGTASATSSNGRVLLLGSLTVGNRGWLQGKYQAGGDAAWSFGFDVNQNVSTVLSTCDACMQITTAGLIQTAANGAPASTGQSLAVGDLARLYVAPSGVVTVEKSTDNGATWTVITTIATLTGTVYPYMYATFSGTPRRIYYPAQHGLILP